MGTHITQADKASNNIMGTHITHADNASKNIMETHITHADKASNNIFVFVYKSHDMDCLIMELGIGISSDNPAYSDDSNKGNPGHLFFMFI